tara:strand:- start:4158 stop:4592 length:435 start_codon:yes stop_codon:yes gene_type:complete
MKLEINNFFLLFFSFFLLSCESSDNPPLMVTDITITQPIPGKSISAGYVTFINNTNLLIELTQVISPDFESIEIHESILDEGIAKMQRVNSLQIEANSKLKLDHGGKHLMLKNKKNKNRVISLHFYSKEKLLLSLKTQLTSRSK